MNRLTTNRRLRFYRNCSTKRNVVLLVSEKSAFLLSYSCLLSPVSCLLQCAQRVEEEIDLLLEEEVRDAGAKAFAAATMVASQALAVEQLPD